MGKVCRVKAKSSAVYSEDADEMGHSVKLSLSKPVGTVFCLILLVSSFLGVVFFQGFLFAFLLFKPRLYRKLCDEVIGSWLIFCASLLETMLGIKMVITGDEIRPGERCLIIMNHRTRLDWMYFWSVLLRQSGVKTEKIILKSPLKHIPGAGWAMQVAAFIFIQRNWEEDKKILSKMVNYFTDLNHKTQVLLFPEGTDLTARTKSKSDDFARKNGVTPYEYVLHPRTTGFCYLLQQMQNNDHLDAVYDVAIAYPYNFPQTEPELMTGNFPKEVHFNVRRHCADQIPTSDAEQQTWCKERWAEKEQLLKQFYVDRRFRQADRNDHVHRKPTRSIELMLKIVLCYWTAFIVGITILLVYSSTARWYALFQICFYIFMCKRGGFELFQADYFNKFFNKNKRN